ncbi:MAG: hypothetical protein V1672_00450 [Candidatus Diapherotrites archaeon]
MDLFIPLVLAIALSITSWFSETYSSTVHIHHVKLTSFSAGLFITYIFLFLFPELFEGLPVAGNRIFLLMLMGFVIFHVLEKYIYQHVTNKKHLLHDLSILHILGFFADHFIVGVLLFLIFREGNIFLSSFVFIPLLLHTISSSLSFTHLGEHLKNKRSITIFLAAAPLFGVLVAYFLNLEHVNYLMILSFVVGAMLYIVVRDALPHGRTGNIFFFLLGFIISFTMLILSGHYAF